MCVTQVYCGSGNVSSSEKAVAYEKDTRDVTKMKKRAPFLCPYFVVQKTRACFFSRERENTRVCAPLLLRGRALALGRALHGALAVVVGSGGASLVCAVGGGIFAEPGASVGGGRGGLRCGRGRRVLRKGLLRGGSGRGLALLAVERVRLVVLCCVVALYGGRIGADLL